jgi:hypothetical protein
VTPPLHRLTGLCSWIMRTASGQYVYDLNGTQVGYDREAAHLWLCQPEHLPALELVRKPSWPGPVTAVRAR